MTTMSLSHLKGLTLLELLAILAIIALLAAAILAGLNARSPSGAPPPASSSLIPYPPQPTGATSGATAAAGIPQGKFVDGLTSHRRLTSETYRFFRYDHRYQLVPSERPRANVIFKVHVSAANVGDNPRIEAISTTTGSRIVTPTDAIVVTDSDGQFDIEIYVPAPEHSGSNTLRILVEEIDSHGTVIRRVLRDDVAIVPP
jgi:hypothetical protein